MPVKHDDKVPLNPISIVVSISDKINTLICFWKIKEKPTGSKDPFGLRRCAIGLIRTLIENKLKLNIRKLIFDYLNIDELNDLFIFLEERFRVYLIERNYDHGVLDACLSYKDFNDPYLTFLKINTINNFKKDNNFKKLTYSYKRAINILNSEEKKNSIIFSKKPLSKLFEEKEEEILFKKITEVEKKVKRSLEKDDFYSALLSLSTFDNEIENFFEKVTINVDNQDVKFNRLNLCNKVRQNMHLVAYFSYINV